MARLEFAGARYVRNYHLAVPHHELVIDKKKSYRSPSYERSEKEGAGGWSPSLEDNLILHGDNLKAIKSLLPHFAGKVKCIYIDPPYNTGNEGWVYNDNVSSPRHKDWLNKVVDKECQDRHDRWLSMMMPRLKLLRELMREDGVIFISIDDNEAAHLRMMMDEIFGEDNFVSDIIWQKKYSPQNDAKYFSDMHDFILVVAKQKNNGQETQGWQRNLVPRSEVQDARYKNPDNDPRGPWKPADLSVKSYSANYDYPIKTPGGRAVKPPQGRSWSTSKETLQKWIEDGRIWFGKEGNNVPSVKIFKSEVQQGVVPTTIWLRDEVGDNELARKEIKSIFGEVELPFDTPKPTPLIKKILQLATGPSDLILDSFAGSGTTAHAVLALNKEDGGNRKFILVEQEDYADTITAERVRRVIKGYGGKNDTPSPNPSRKREGNGVEGLGGSFTYVTLGAEYDVGKILSGKSLPSYEEMAAYVFQTATGDTLDRKKIDKKSKYIGSSKLYDVYLLYEPSVEKLKSSECALKLDFVEGLPKKANRKALVFGAVRYVNQETLTKHNVEFSQLPYEVYRRIDDAA